MVRPPAPAALGTLTTLRSAPARQAFDHLLLHHWLQLILEICRMVPVIRNNSESMSAVRLYEYSLTLWIME
jgi:hypothetical protein